MTGPEATITEDASVQSTSGSHMQIGVVAERLGLSIRSLHHWEEMGLVKPSARSVGGFRLYTEEDVQRLILMRRMKPLGYSLEEIRDFLDALDVLDNSEDEQARTQSAAVLDTVRRRLAESRASLHQRLSWADEFEQILDTESTRRQLTTGPATR
jgi:MerR family copper efflux transcriptional regulator